MRDRDWLAGTFVELADTLVSDFDVVDFLARLSERIVELVDAAEVGLVLADQRGHMRVMASSTERMRVLELFEVQSEEGPCFDSARSGTALINVRLADELGRWPEFAPMARAHGYEIAHAFPLRLRDDVIGAVNVFHEGDRQLSVEEARLVQAFADVATIGILQERALRQATELAEQLQGALVSRIVIEQAKGMLAERLTIDTDEAFVRMRAYARGHNMRLGDVARQVVDGVIVSDAIG